MPRVLKILIALLIVIVLVSGALFFIARRQIRKAVPQDPSALIDAVRENQGGAAAPAPPVSAPPRSVPAPTPPPAPAPVAPADPMVQLKSDLAHLAMLFAERWGTFSNEQSVSSVASLTSLMTVGVQQFAASEHAQLRAAHPDPAVLYRIQTRALNVKEQQFNPESGRVSFLVATQRVEVSGAASNRRTLYQDLEVRLHKEDGLWKIDGAYWREKSQ